VETLNLVSDWIARTLDYPLGWMLALPRDVAIVTIAIGTSLLLTLARKWTTDQGYLLRSKNDIRRLKQLRREAKRAKDKSAVKRIRTTIGMINLTKMKSEGLPLLVSIVPIALLAIWALARLDYYPPKVGEPLTVKAYYPVSSISQAGRFTHTHLVAPKSVEVKGEAVQEVREDPKKGPGGQVNGLAEWNVVPTVKSDSLVLVIGHQDQTVEHPLSAGADIYAPPLKAHSSGKIQVTEVMLKRAKFLGFVPGIPEIMFPPWLVAYLIIVIPFVPLLRRGLKVY